MQVCVRNIQEGQIREEAPILVQGRNLRIFEIQMNQIFHVSQPVKLGSRIKDILRLFF